MKHRTTSVSPTEFQHPSNAPLLMNIKPWIDLSKWKQSVGFSIYLAALCVLWVQPMVGQTDEKGVWRRTSLGWEYAHAVQQPSKVVIVPEQFELPTMDSSVAKWHRIVLPVATSSFMVTFGCWLLISVRNRGIIRQLPKSALN